eukprot:GHVL01032626.1.p1 GENE.GHVL01032626.1~~GHVL01032626.1.p1  ORF type:complete len:1896 (-),score=378.18 GHVL01032626.1:64-5433(-)
MPVDEETAVDGDVDDFASDVSDDIDGPSAASNSVEAAVIEQMSSPKQTQVKAMAPATPSPTASTAATTNQSSGHVLLPPMSSSVDRPVDALHALRVLVATRLQLTLDEVLPSMSVRGLCGGKSALQNEVIGDVSNEFGDESEGVADKSLDIVSKEIGSRYTKMGKVLTAITARNITKWMPPGYNQFKVKSELALLGMGPNSQEGTLIHLNCSLPTTKLSNTNDAMTYLKNLAESYAILSGFSLPSASPCSETPHGDITAIIDPIVMETLKNKLRKAMAAIYEFTDPQNDHDRESDDFLIDVVDEAEMAVNEGKIPAYLLEEHGLRYLQLVKPKYDVLKVRKYDGWWNWIRLEAFQYIRTGSVEGANGCDADACDASETTIMEKQYFLQKIRNTANASLVSLLKAQAEGAGGISEEQQCRAATLYREAVRGLATPPTFLETRGCTIPEIKISDEGVVSRPEKARMRYKKNGMEEFAADMFSPNRCLNDQFSLNEASPGVLREANPKMKELFESVMKEFATEGCSWTGRTALITGATEGNIAWEIMHGLLKGGCSVIATTNASRGSAAYKPFEKAYRKYSSKNAYLVVVPLNAASRSDARKLIDDCFEVFLPGLLTSQQEVENYFPSERYPTLPHLDLFIPFAALAETGRNVTMIDDQSEAAHRAMLTNVIRCIGRIIEKSPKGVPPCHVLVPLSPNKGLFGGDGMYAESKIGLETLFAKWRSEEWQNCLSIIGAEIGWVRGTGLMANNDIIAPRIESEVGIRTFSTVEMGFSLLSLFHPKIVEACRAHPLRVDLTGGFRNSANGIPSQRIHSDIKLECSMKKALSLDKKKDIEAVSEPIEKSKEVVSADHKANIHAEFPPLPSPHDRCQLRHLQGMMDLSTQVVVVGFGEVGPWGSSRTRWEMEVWGELSIAGSVELARWMSLIRYHTGGPLPSGVNHVGWVKVSDDTPISEKDIWPCFGDYILANCGVRNIDPDWFLGYSPASKMFLQQMALEADISPFDVSSNEEAEYFKHFHGKRVDVEPNGTDRWRVSLKEGARVYVPKTKPFDRRTGGQPPRGFNVGSFGFPKDLLNRIDRVTQWGIMACQEALASAGISDTYELYQHCNLSEVGNAFGTGMGGQNSMRDVFKERWIEEDVKGDALQETFVNTPAAWINMLMFSSAGPVRPCAAACATAAVSVDLGAEIIRSRRAKFMVVGGTEDMTEESSYEFASMKATNDSMNEQALGRMPSEASRPFTTSRAGFVEAMGSAVQLLASAKLAIEMGLPIYAVVAGSTTATDRDGRSVPAPGRGILSTCTEAHIDNEDPQDLNLLDVAYRKEQLASDLSYIQQSTARLKPDVNSHPDEGKRAIALTSLMTQLTAREAAAKQFWSSGFWLGNPRISPLRGMLNQYGLNINDVDVCSMHGTSTALNDSNESSVLSVQLRHLGRSLGHPLPTIWQKWLTGHPKGPAAGWMINGVIQSMHSGIIPGQRNADNPDTSFQRHDLLFYSDRNINIGRTLKSALVHSFGFGQANSEVVLVHSNYVLACIDDESLACYSKLRAQRQQSANRLLEEGVLGVVPHIKVKSRPPFNEEAYDQALLNPAAKAIMSPEGHYVIQAAQTVPSSTGLSEIQELENLMSKLLLDLELPMQSSGYRPRTTSAVLDLADSGYVARGGYFGIDVEPFDVFSRHQEGSDYLTRNFTESELSYCFKSPNPARALAGRWAAKEAVIKALTAKAQSVKSDTIKVVLGPEAPNKDIEILSAASDSDTSALPIVNLHGHAKEVAQEIDAKNVSVTISHTPQQSVAIAVVQ